MIGSTLSELQELRKTNSLLSKRIWRGLIWWWDNLETDVTKRNDESRLILSDKSILNFAIWHFLASSCFWFGYPRHGAMITTMIKISENNWEEWWIWYQKIAVFYSRLYINIYVYSWSSDHQLCLIVSPPTLWVFWKLMQLPLTRWAAKSPSACKSKDPLAIRLAFLSVKLSSEQLQGYPVKIPC